MYVSWATLRARLYEKEMEYARRRVLLYEDASIDDGPTEEVKY